MKGLALVVLLSSLLAVESVVAQPAEILIDAPDDLAIAANHLRHWRPERLASFQRLIDLPVAGPPIRVILLTEGSIPAASVPPWVAGFAQPDGLVVLFPARVPVYPYSSLDELLGHEVAHVLIARAAGGEMVPRWFNEGLAMLAEEAWDWGDRSRAALALMRSENYPVANLDRRFAGSASEVSSAYALSAAFVRWLVGHYDRQMPAEVLGRLALGEPFETAFLEATGDTLEEAEVVFWRRQAIWTRWLPLLGNSTTLWVLVTLLALWAIKRRRDRDREIEAVWEMEEQAFRPDPDESIH